VVLKEKSAPQQTATTAFNFKFFSAESIEIALYLGFIHHGGIKNTQNFGNTYANARPYKNVVSYRGVSASCVTESLQAHYRVSIV
jgi:hypothetical protein